MKKSKDVYRKRQQVLLICIAVILIAVIILLMYLFIFRDKKEIGNDTASVSSAGSTEAVPADAQDSDDENYNSITFEENEITIKVGEKYTPKLKNLRSSDDIFDWKSSNNAVAVVSDSGEITGIGVGTCDITVCVHNTDT
ncbi:MAG: Ig-like domain-containing protein, partial [Oscillospiraceae bacterium]|nr:Ig-like domain-containing protein [Oscillospiraceae bacterium]